MYWNQIATKADNSTVSWIVTLDVLKFDTINNIADNIQLNSNIRCIEMLAGVHICGVYNVE